MPKPIASHTPGPWAIDVPDAHDPNAHLAHRYVGNDGRVAMTMVDSGSGDWPQGVALANALLIASAPDLLARVRDANRILEHCLSVMTTEQKIALGELVDRDDLDGTGVTRRDARDAAIAKATGGAS